MSHLVDAHSAQPKALEMTPQRLKNKAMADPACPVCKGVGTIGPVGGGNGLTFACTCVSAHLAGQRTKARREIEAIAKDMQAWGDSHARRQGRRLAKALAVLR